MLSCVGVMFAPHHQRAADELVRVCRPGGTIGLISWTPEAHRPDVRDNEALRGGAAARSAAAADVGQRDYVRGLLGDGITDFTAQHRALTVDRSPTGCRSATPSKPLWADDLGVPGIAGEPDRAAALDAALAELGDRYLAGSSTMEWEYLLVTARKR